MPFFLSINPTSPQAEVVHEMRRLRRGLSHGGAVQFCVDGFSAYDLDVCIGFAQCIGFCPNIALQLEWKTDATVFQEKLIETVAAVWREIEECTVLINAMLNMTTECDCWPGKNQVIHPDQGFVGAYHPIRIVGEETFNSAHPDIPWKRQFSYVREIGF